MIAAGDPTQLLTHSNTTGTVIAFATLLVALGVVYKTLIRPAAKVLRQAVNVHTLLLGDDSNPGLKPRLEQMNGKLDSLTLQLGQVARIEDLTRIDRQIVALGQRVEELGGRVKSIEGALDLLKEAETQDLRAAIRLKGLEARNIEARNRERSDDA